MELTNFWLLLRWIGCLCTAFKERLVRLTTMKGIVSNFLIDISSTAAQKICLLHQAQLWSPLFVVKSQVTVRVCFWLASWKYLKKFEGPQRGARDQTLRPPTQNKLKLNSCFLPFFHRTQNVFSNFQPHIKQTEKNRRARWNHHRDGKSEFIEIYLSHCLNFEYSISFSFSNFPNDVFPFSCNLHQ